MLTRKLGEIIERIFTRGNRRLGLQVEHISKRVDRLDRRTAKTVEVLQRRHEARLKAIERALRRTQSLSTQVDRIATDIPHLFIALEREHRQIQGALETVVPQTVEPLTTLIGRIAGDIPKVAEGIDQEHHDVREALDSLRHEHELWRRDLEALRARPPVSASDAVMDIYSAPPTLRRIPGWHTGWGTEKGSDPFLKSRLDIWSSLKSPVPMRWFADLIVIIWPGNELSRVLFLTGNFEPNELVWLTHTLTPGMTMIDVGAHIGTYSMIASKLVGDSGVIVAIEPSTREFQRLTHHVELNHLENVRCLQEAASDTVGEVLLKIASEWNSGHNTLGEFFDPSVEQAREERVRTRTVDAIVAAQTLQRVDVLKIDAEGHELKVLAGATETVARFRPRILIEVFEDTLQRQGASVEALFAFLTRRGYELNEFSETTGEVTPLTDSFGRGSRNIVALPKQPSGSAP